MQRATCVYDYKMKTYDVSLLIEAILFFFLESYFLYCSKFQRFRKVELIAVLLRKLYKCSNSRHKVLESD